MQVNITFLIQIVNFWVTYFFLKRFLFKPFINFLDQRGERIFKMVDLLKDQEVFLNGKIKAKNKALADFRIYLKKKYAYIPVCVPKRPEQISYVKDVKEQERLLIKTKELFIKGASNACRP